MGGDIVSCPLRLYCWVSSLLYILACPKRAASQLIRSLMKCRASISHGHSFNNKSFNMSHQPMCLRSNIGIHWMLIGKTEGKRMFRLHKIQAMQYMKAYHNVPTLSKESQRRFTIIRGDSGSVAPCRHCYDSCNF